jgi:F0F1-type ATP synthase membrane subunit b/b'
MKQILLKIRPKKKYQEYLSLISNSKKEAQELINVNKQSLQSNFENKKKEIDKKLEEKMKEVSKEIDGFKKTAANTMSSISTEVAKELVKTVSKIDTNNASASSIVEEVSKKYLKGLN